VSRDQSGYSLIELLAASALLVLVLGAVLALLDTAGALAPQDQERGHAVREAQVGMTRMTRELRGATQLEAAGPYVLTARMLRGGSEVTVTYNCGGAAADPTWGQCVRTAVPGTGQPSVLIKAFTNKNGSGGTPVFSYTTRADGQITYLEIHTDVVVKDRASSRYDYRVPLTAGVYLRNLDG
jgi:type II secretory pathway pseudopilin PulG